MMKIFKFKLEFGRRSAAAGTEQMETEPAKKWLFADAWRRLSGNVADKARQLRQSYSPAKTVDMRVTHFYRGREYASIIVPVDGRTIAIGTGSGCELQVPQEDRRVADRHVELTFDTAGVKVNVLDGDGVLFNGGKRKTFSFPRKGRFALGDSEFVVATVAVKHHIGSDYNRLECLGWESASAADGFYDLDKPEMTIGSADDNDIVLPDDVVSAHHAQLRITDRGETWITDLGSTNGTYVNGTRLGNRERMLMDVDDISFAHYDMRYLDRNVFHPRSNAKQTLSILAVVIAIVLAVAGIVYIFQPRADKLLAEARLRVSRADFTGAEKILRRVPTAGGFKQEEGQYMTMMRNFSSQRRYYQSWMDFQSYMANEEWGKAVREYGTLEKGMATPWDADSNERQARAESIIHAKKLLDVWFSLHGLLMRSNNPLTAFANYKKHRDEAWLQENFGDDEPDWLKPLCKDISQLAVKAEEKSALMDKFAKLLNEINVKDTDIKRLVEEMKNIESESSGVVGLIIRPQVGLAELFLEIDEKLARNNAAISDFRFEEVDPVEEIPSKDICAEIPQFDAKRDQVIACVKNQMLNRDSLPELLGSLRRLGLEIGTVPESVKLMSDDARISELFGKMGRNQASHQGKPVDGFDEFFGYGYFYRVMAQNVKLTTNVYNDIQPRNSFSSKFAVMKRQFDAVESMYAWLSAPANADLMTGKYLELYNYCKLMLEYRDKVAEKLAALAEKREKSWHYVFAKTAQFYIMPPGRVTESDFAKLRQAWRNYRKTALDLVDAFENSDAGDRKVAADKLRGYIAPGDPAWADLGTEQ
ncbi:MAG: FHA domain-containing protein [Victivallaceae bacterium]|nr:FHA domain-containing protein [Victivallaceae bacterium]